jgi:four helix bundle protein
MFNFEKLDVWQEAIQFADLVYELTVDFPDEERFGLTSQMRRAAVSISSKYRGRKFTRIAARISLGS